MLNPKQNLTSFTRIYQAKSALSQMALDGGATEFAFGGVVAEFAQQNTVRESDASALSTLSQTHSISTIEELAALARLDATQGTHFIKDLGLPSDLSTRVIDQLRRVRPQTLVDIERFEKLQYTLGCDVDFSSPPPTLNAFQPAVVEGVTFGTPAPPTDQPAAAVVNLIDSNMPPIRDQADRGACVAFASLACLEYHLNRFGNQTGLDLSEQFHYWNIVTTAQRRLVSAYPLLANAGSCREITWPYYGKVMAGNDSQGPAPASAAAEASAYCCNQVRRILARDISAIQAELRRGRVVAVAIAVYKSWYNSGTVRQYGNITVPIAGEVPGPEAHAIALVGYADDSDYAGGGYFIVRNSWDSHWGTQSVFGPGYGTIPYRYISNFNWDAWCIVS